MFNSPDNVGTGAESDKALRFLIRQDPRHPREAHDILLEVDRPAVHRRNAHEFIMKTCLNTEHDD